MKAAMLVHLVIRQGKMGENHRKSFDFRSIGLSSANVLFF